MLALPMEATVEEKTNICTDRRRWRLQIIQESLDQGIETHNTQQTPRREYLEREGENLEWEGVNDIILEQSSELSFGHELELLSRGVQSVFRFRRHTCCIVGKQGTFQI